MLDPMALDYIDLITPYLKHVKNWNLHFCILPRKCYLTSKIIWMNHCYFGSSIVADNIVVEFYIDKNEFLIWSLKN
jgi:hypothetical protein